MVANLPWCRNTGPSMLLAWAWVQFTASHENCSLAGASCEKYVDKLPINSQLNHEKSKFHCLFIIIVFDNVL